MRFSGTPQEQARCLLQSVGRGAHLGGPLARLPEPLDRLPETSVTLTKQQLRTYLVKNGIAEEDIGGGLDSAVSKTSNGYDATYFVIHDTSTLLEKRTSFPESINTAAWPLNDLSRWTDAITHVYVNRLGQSKTVVDFHTPLGSTKLDPRNNPRLNGLFLAVESIQPRRSDPRGAENNDLIAPDPGFTPAQLKRLALIYVAASVRRGQWLIPAFHAVIDTGFRNGHDDPQNFDLSTWADDIQSVIREAGRP
jgi:hypothetical protein